MQWLKDRSWINKYIFPVPTPPTYDKDAFPQNMRKIPRTKDIPYDLSANFFRVESSNQIVLYSHGNYEDLGGNFHAAQQFSDSLKINFLVYDYSGYGINEGTPNESTLKSDIRRVYEYVMIELKFQPQNIILFGRSLGNGPTLDLAAELSRKNISIGAVVLLSPFTSVCDLVREAFSQAGSYLMADRFVNKQMVQQYNGPLFIIHGQQDELIRPSQSQQLYELSISKIKYAHFPVEMTHNDIDYDSHIITPVAWFLAKLYHGQREPIGQFTQISLTSVSSPKQKTSLMQVSRGISATVVDLAHNAFTKKESKSTFSTSQLTTKEGLTEYITNRLNNFAVLLFEKYLLEKEHTDIPDPVIFVYDKFLLYEPFVNIYVELTKLRVALPPGAAMFAKSVHMMQSAPVGLLHAQLCIGGLVYSWDQEANGEATETNFDHLTDERETVRIPVRIYHIRKRWARLMFSWIALQEMEGADKVAPQEVAARIANEFVDCYFDMFPDMAPLHTLVQKWTSSHHYQAATQNCQDFLSEAMDALKLTHMLSPDLHFSAPLVTYIKRVYADPSLFAPSLYGNTGSEFVATWSAANSATHGVDYALMAVKHFLRSGRYSSPELIRLHQTFLRTLIKNRQDIQNNYNYNFVVYKISNVK